MATPHIESKKEDINKRVLMPGDPKRCKYIANKYLTDVRVVNNVRNMTAYTGKYKGIDITLFPSGMGMPSMGIYAYELFKFYDVDNIIRIGTSGAHREDAHVLDVVMATSSYTLSNYAYLFDGIKENEIYASTDLNDKIRSVSEEKSIAIKEGKIITTDIFDVYVDDKDRYDNLYPQDLNALACEMEAFALFYMAKKFNKNASCLATIVDSKYEEKEVSSEDREKSLDDMIVLALEAIIK